MRQRSGTKPEECNEIFAMDRKKNATCTGDYLIP